MNYLKQDKLYSENLNHQIKEMGISIDRAICENISNVGLSRTFSKLKEDLTIISNLISLNPRFFWVSVQEEMDDTYRRDRSITGYLLKCDFKESENPKRAIINAKIKKGNHE